MYGEGAYATGPYATLLTVLFVAASIHIDQNILFHAFTKDIPISHALTKDV